VFAFPGALVSLLVGPWLKFLASFQLSADNFTLDCMSKAVLNQLSITPLITCLFLILFTTTLGGVKPAALADHGVLSALLAKGFGKRYVRTASYWLAVDFFNLLIMPVTII